MEDGRQVFVSKAPKLGFCPPLDGLRALAVIMVILAHAQYEVFGSLVAGVDLFFVVSGFLITTLLMEERRNDDHIDIRKFYVRRILRLFPPLYVALAMTLVASLLIGNQHFIHQTWNDSLSAFFYVYHVVHPVHAELLTGKAPELRPFIHLWSLSVEEHFYLVAAVMVAVVIKRRLVLPLAALFIGLWIAIGIARLTGHVGFKMMWYQRPDSLLLGVVAAVVNASMPTEWSDATKRLAGRLATAAVLVAGVTIFVGTKFAKPLGAWVHFIPPEHRSLHTGTYWGEFGFTIVAACAAVITVVTVRHREHWVARVLSWRPLLPIGRRSYLLYLFHVPIWIILLKIFPGSETSSSKGGLVLLLYLIFFPLTVELVHRYVEKPSLRLKSRFEGKGIEGIPIS